MSQLNASTGPRTAEGKAISSQNARKHGLTSASPLIPEDLREAYNELEASLRRELHPDDVSQEVTFRHILANAWNLVRIEKMEAEAQDLDTLLKLQRYRSAAERGYHRSRNELANLQTHQFLQDQIPATEDPPAPPFADARLVAQYTRRSGHPGARRTFNEDAMRFLALLEREQEENKQAA